MTFSRVTEEQKRIKMLHQSLYYYKNKNYIQKQQREYRENNKEKVKYIWINASKRYRKKHKHAFSMYKQLINLAKREGYL